MNKHFTFTYKLAVLFCSVLLSMAANGQSDSSRVRRQLPDSGKKTLNMDAVYNRPFLSAGKLPVAVGGYLEANTQYAVTNGISEGFSFQMRRLTLFFSSTVARRIKFLSEIEFEDGTREINLEFAAIDVELHPLFTLRGGVLMNPIGAFNQNHDGPRWDFIDRPISATTLLPATLSNAGFGVHGKTFSEFWVLGYEAYLTNGFDDRIISNADGRTSLTAGKRNPTRFEESNSGLPMFTGKLALRHRKAGELGLSLMDGVYNKFEADGFTLDHKRRATALAIDMNTTFWNSRLTLTGEAVKILVDVPATYSQAYGNQQGGAFLDVVATVLQRRIGSWDKAKLNLGVRFEYADYNIGRFHETGGRLGDERMAIVPAIAFRPAGATVIRFNYRYEKQRDLLGNPPSRTGVIQFGFSSYF